MAAVLLEECEHPYTLEMMALFTDGAGGADYAQLNPWRQVPALQTDRGLVTEVIAIAEELDQMHPERALWPKDPWQRVQALRWYSCLSTTIQPYVRCIVRPERFVADNAVRARILREQVTRLIVDSLTLVDAELGDNAWLVGDEFGPADALLATIAGWVQRMRLPLASLNRLKLHAARCRARPAFARAIERHGIEPNIVSTTAAAALLGVTAATRAE